MYRWVAAAIALLAAIAGLLFEDDPWRLGNVGYPVDQVAVAHRDSVYSHVTWAASEADNSYELRFFDKVEGGVCLQPSWDELAGFGLDHLAMPADFPIGAYPAGPTWPEGRPKPNPGTLSHTRYITAYVTGVLLNDRLIDAAGGNWRQAAPRVLIVGLGSGVGVSLLTHHWPEANIEVVDIDQVVIDMVREHYPFLRWLEGQQTTTGAPRLAMTGKDARVFVRQQIEQPEDHYDLVIVDAYTSGSTIPPHLMTREFYDEIRQCLRPGGIVLSNIIGSYEGKQKLVLGGAMRSMRAAGLTHLMNFPISRNDQASFQEHHTRNNIVLVSADQALRPDRNSTGWDRLQRFVDDEALYQQLPTGVVTGELAFLFHQEEDQSVPMISSEVGLHILKEEPPFDRLTSQLRQLLINERRKNPEQTYLRLYHNNHPDLIDELAAAVSQHYDAASWRPRPAVDGLFYYRVDWVEESRAHLAGAVALAKSKSGRFYNHAGEQLVGPLEDDRDGVPVDWTIVDAPLFTDLRPNADILNH